PSTSRAFARKPPASLPPTPEQGQNAMSQDTLFARIVASESRPNPYPLYAIMRNTPVARQADGTFVVSSYDAIYRLLYDPRLSSEDLPPPLWHWTGNPIKDLIFDP